MPLKKYAVLKAHVIDSQPATGSSPHYQVRVVDDEKNYRISINVKSSENPTDLEYILIQDFNHPILTELANLPLGLKKLGQNKEERKNSGIALDFIRMNLFDRALVTPIPSFRQGADNDLNDKINAYVDYAMGDENNLIYAFGEPWENEQKTDKYFGFLPGNGIHDIHMNQGSLIEKYKNDDGVYQDGGLIFYFAADNRYVAYFTKFQSQTWHTDDETGHALDGFGQAIDKPEEMLEERQPDYKVRIVAAMVNPIGNSPEKEQVTLLNTTSQQVNLEGWHLADRTKNKMPLSGNIAPGGVIQIEIEQPVQLSNQGGIITLLNSNGLKVHGVSYTKNQASREGETIVFN
jgi:uncharacterized protein YukJ